MKTAISIPDPIFQAAENMAHHLGVSRSELFATAISEYMKRHKYRNVTESLNEVYKGTDSKLDEKLALMQWKSVQEDKW